MANSKSRVVRGRLFASTLLAGAAALGAPAAVGLVATLAAAPAMAQDYTSGTLGGTVTDGSGAPVSGARVTVRSQQTGVSQTSTTDAAGSFRAPLIPSGSYTVSITKDGFAPTTQSDLAVRIGGTSNYTFALSPVGGDVSEVVVVAKKAQPQLDFSQTTKGISIDVEQLQKQVPIARNVTAVALLAPGVVTSVPGFTNTDGSLVPSIGGGSAGENAYYLNGLNITNFDTYIGGATVPFDFYKTIEVKTGGYSAEFGRATGGVINAVTKSGTNDFYFGVHGNYEPDFARSTPENTFVTNGARSRRDVSQTNVEFGGPILKDHLFFYGIYQLNHAITESAGNQTGTFLKDRNNSPFYGYKIDGYLTSRQHFEFTDFNTSSAVFENAFGFTPPAANFVNPADSLHRKYINGGTDPGILGAYQASDVQKFGGNNWVAKYTGTFTDWFTISGAYGRSHDRSYTLPTILGVNYVADGRADGVGVGYGPLPAASEVVAIDRTFREFYRVDADVYVNFLGKHHFRGGYDNEDTQLQHAEFLNGPNNRAYTYYLDSTFAGAFQNDTEYVDVLTENLGNNGASVKGTNEAFYVQDSWDVTRNFNVQLGIRDDIFKLSNLSGEQVLNLKDNFAGRVALSYDPFGNKTDKFFASYGRYFIPPASNLSFRGHDFYFDAYYLPPNGATTFAGYIDPVTKAPTALGPLITTTTPGQVPGGELYNYTGTQFPCPVGAPQPGALGCAVYGNGTQEPAATKASKELEATHEDEIIVGYQKKLTSLWSVGATVTYRNLGNVSEDIDNLGGAIISYCTRNPSHAGCNLTADQINGAFGTLPDYKIINPGKGATVTVRKDLIDPTGAPSPLAGQTFALTKEDLGFPTPKREYYALELTFDRAFDGKWSLSGSYTLSKSVGNYEGTVKSDVGASAQTDAGSTTEFDYPGLEDYGYGLLPNHRAHQIKLYGSYQIFSGLLIGADLQVTSPRRYGCQGVYEGGIDPFAATYGSVSHYCFGKPAPRGDYFSGDWFKQFDMSIRYTVPKFMKYQPGNLVLRADVFNLFDSQDAILNEERGETAGGSPRGQFQLPRTLQTPRYVRFGFDLTF